MVKNPLFIINIKCDLLCLKKLLITINELKRRTNEKQVNIELIMTDDTYSKQEYLSFIQQALWYQGNNDVSRAFVRMTRHYLHNKLLSASAIFELLNQAQVTFPKKQHHRILEHLVKRVHNIGSQDSQYIINQLANDLTSHLQDHYYLDTELPAELLLTHVNVIESSHQPKSYEIILDYLKEAYSQILEQQLPEYYSAIKTLHQLKSIPYQPDVTTISNALEEPDSRFKHLRLLLWEYTAPINWQEALAKLDINKIAHQPNTLHWFFKTVIDQPKLPALQDTISQLTESIHPLTRINQTLNKQDLSLSILYHQACQAILTSTSKSKPLRNQLLIKFLLKHLNSNNINEDYFLLAQQITHPSNAPVTTLSSYFDLLNTILIKDNEQAWYITLIINNKLPKIIPSLAEQPATFQCLNNLLDSLSQSPDTETIWHPNGIGIAYFRRCLPTTKQLQSPELTIDNNQTQAQNLLYNLIINQRLDKHSQTSIIKQIPQSKSNLWYSHKHTTSNPSSEASTILQSKTLPADQTVKLNNHQLILKEVFDTPRSYFKPKPGHGIYQLLERDIPEKQLNNASSWTNFFRNRTISGSDDIPEHTEATCKIIDASTR